MNRTKEIIKRINQMSDSKSPVSVFGDWVKATALAIACSCMPDPIRENEYRETIKNYSAYEFAELAAMLTETCSEEMCDILGNLYMMSGWGNKNTGQFFTPYTVGMICAQMIDHSDDEVITLNEPAAGTGGMIIAAAKIMNDKGKNWQRNMRVIAQELDITSAYMCYIQLSLYGINAKVIQGNTLESRKHSNFDGNVFLTPMYFLDGARW